MIRELTCIICPRGCSLKIELKQNIIKVEGNACPKGRKYAIDECTHPVRTVTSSVRVSNREDTMVSVKTVSPVAKELIWSTMEAIRATEVTAPIKIGDVLLKDVCGTDIVATKNIL